MAAWRMDAGRPPYWPRFPGHFTRIRQLLLGRELVSRLRFVLRSLRRRQEGLSNCGATQPAEARREEITVQRHPRRGAAGFGVSCSGLAENPHTRKF